MRGLSLCGRRLPGKRPRGEGRRQHRSSQRAGTDGLALSYTRQVEGSVAGRPRRPWDAGGPSGRRGASVSRVRAPFFRGRSRRVQLPALRTPESRSARGRGAGDKNTRGSTGKRLLGTCRLPTARLSSTAGRRGAVGGGGPAGQAAFSRGGGTLFFCTPPFWLADGGPGPPPADGQGGAAPSGVLRPPRSSGRRRAWVCLARPPAQARNWLSGCRVNRELARRSCRGVAWLPLLSRRGARGRLAGAAPPCLSAATCPAGNRALLPATDSRPPLGVARFGPGEAPTLGPRPLRHDSRRRLACFRPKGLRGVAGGERLVYRPCDWGRAKHLAQPLPSVAQAQCWPCWGAEGGGWLRRPFRSFLYLEKKHPPPPPPPPNSWEAAVARFAHQAIGLDA